jgi:hypothetical protein
MCVLHLKIIKQKKEKREKTEIYEKDSEQTNNKQTNES